MVLWVMVKRGEVRGEVAKSAWHGIFHHTNVWVDHLHPGKSPQYCSTELHSPDLWRKTPQFDIRFMMQMAQRY